MKSRFSILLFLMLSFPLLTFCYQTYKLPSGLIGPESLAFDCKGEGPYTGVSDGRILKWQGLSGGWKEFAIPHHSRKRHLCDGYSDPNFETTCGRPLGLRIHNITCELYIADSYFGLMKVKPGGGVASLLASSADGVPFRFTNALDIDQENNVIYFTDSSTKYQRKDHLKVVQSGDSTGRLMKYDMRSRTVTVLLRDLPFPNGVALSKDNSYVLVAETSRYRILRYWLKGSRADTAEVFSYVPGAPDNIKRNARGEFWVALSDGRTSSSSGDEIIAVRLDGEGNYLEMLLSNSTASVSEVCEDNGSLYMGSVAMPWVGVSAVQVELPSFTSK